MQDYLYKGRIEELEIAFSLCIATHVVQDAVVRHDCDPVSAHLMGRALTAGLLAAAQLGDYQRLNLHWTYSGHLRTLVVDAGPDATVRGLISPTDLAAYEGDKAALYGEHGQIHVTRSRDGQIFSSSTTNCQLQEIVEDLAFFISSSDQVETGLSIQIGFKPDVENPIDLCQGLLIQALPGCDLNRFEAIRIRLQAPEVRDLLRHPNASDNYFEVLLNTLVEPVWSRPIVHLSDCGRPRFVCTCTQEKMVAVLRAIPEPERAAILKTKEELVVHCQFCRSRYMLTTQDCRAAWHDRGLETGT